MAQVIMVTGRNCCGKTQWMYEDIGCKIADDGIHVSTEPIIGQLVIGYLDKGKLIPAWFYGDKAILFQSVTASKIPEICETMLDYPLVDDIYINSVHAGAFIQHVSFLLEIPTIKRICIEMRTDSPILVYDHRHPEVAVAARYTMQQLRQLEEKEKESIRRKAMAKMKRAAAIAAKQNAKDAAAKEEVQKRHDYNAIRARLQKQMADAIASNDQGQFEAAARQFIDHVRSQESPIIAYDASLFGKMQALAALRAEYQELVKERALLEKALNSRVLIGCKTCPCCDLPIDGDAMHAGIIDRLIAIKLKIGQAIQDHIKLGLPQQFDTILSLVAYPD